MKITFITSYAKMISNLLLVVQDYIIKIKPILGLENTSLAGVKSVLSLITDLVIRNYLMRIKHIAEILLMESIVIP